MKLLTITRTLNALKQTSFGMAMILAILLSPVSPAYSHIKNDSLPIILSFKAVPATTTHQGKQKQVMAFSWKTEGAEKVRLYHDEIEIGGRSQLPGGEVGWPLNMEEGFKTEVKKMAVYKLVAENQMGKTSKILEVEMPVKDMFATTALPVIIEFRISPATGKPGAFGSFFWKTKEADQVRLYDGFGEIKSTISQGDGTIGWPLNMSGEMQESFNSSTTYRLEATNAAGTTSQSFDVIVDESCKLVVTITGKYAQHTDGVGVMQTIPGNPDKFLFKNPVSTVRDHRKSKDATSFQQSTVTVPPGDYIIIPIGGGKDNHGDFGVIYKPGRNSFTCQNGTPGKISVVADFAEY